MPALILLQFAEALPACALSAQGHAQSADLALLCRYADVIVHRLLGASLALSVLPESIQDRQNLRGLSDNLNTRHRNAQFAGRASVELYTLLFFLNKPTLADGRITKASPAPLLLCMQLLAR